MADHGARQLQQPVGGAADVHQVGGQQEERHRQQDERVVGVERLLHQIHRVEPRLDREDRQAGERERERDRHAQEHEAEEAAEQNERRHSRRQTEPGHAASPGNDPEVVEHLLAEKDDPRHAGHRPGDVDDQSGRSASSDVRFQANCVNSMPAQTNTQAATSTPRRPSRARERLAARRQLRPQSTSKCVDSRTPIMAPIMIVQMNMKRAISSVQM